MNRYMVEPFCGLSLWFVAYDEKDLTEMKEKTIENSMYFGCTEAIFTLFPQLFTSLLKTSELDHLLRDMHYCSYLEFYNLQIH